jgi:hypothetical protein
MVLHLRNRALAPPFLAAVLVLPACDSGMDPFTSGPAGRDGHRRGE